MDSQKISYAEREHWRTICLILSSLGYFDLMTVPGFGQSSWKSFRANPSLYLVSASDCQAAAFWAIIEKRMARIGETL